MDRVFLLILLSKEGGRKMSSGKVHATYGAAAGIAVACAYSYKTNTFNPGIIAPIIIGSVVGSLIQDLDSVRSKASQAFNRILLACILVLIGSVTLSKFTSAEFSSETLGYLGYLISQVLGLCNSLFGLVLFCIVCVIGHVSPHRQFTHKIVGFLCFAITAFLAFPKILVFGFILGMLTHVIADKRTPAGLDFFDIKLPFQDKDGKVKIHI